MIVVDRKSCTGCELCELVCSISNEGEFNPNMSRIYVYRDPFSGDFHPQVCAQCSDPKCLSACPENAISVDEKTGAKLISGERCKACGKCSEACPMNSEGKVVKYHPRSGVYVKCDLCGGEPVCVDYCPSGSLSYTKG